MALRALGIGLRKAELLAVLEGYGKNQHTDISFLEFVEIVTERQSRVGRSEEVSRAFGLFDSDASGVITGTAPTSSKSKLSVTALSCAALKLWLSALLSTCSSQPSQDCPRAR